jgi:hypothetical protein
MSCAARRDPLLLAAQASDAVGRAPAHALASADGTWGTVRDYLGFERTVKRMAL